MPGETSVRQNEADEKTGSDDAEETGVRCKEAADSACGRRKMRLSAEHISYRYPEAAAEVFSDVCFKMEHTEGKILVGPSGCGKTTFGRILAGYQKPSAGQVFLDEKPLPKRGYCPVQMVWQHPELAVNPRVKMRKVLDEGDRIDGRILRGLGIEEDWCDRYPQELSGGELQRFCIARAIGAGTRFLIADEISAMLDLITQSQIWTFLLKELREREIGLLVISHDSRLVSYLKQQYSMKVISMRELADGAAQSGSSAL